MLQAIKEDEHHDTTSSLLDSPDSSGGRGSLYFCHRFAILLKYDALGGIEVEGHRMLYYIKRPEWLKKG